MTEVEMKEEQVANLTRADELLRSIGMGTGAFAAGVSAARWAIDAALCTLNNEMAEIKARTAGL